MLLQRTCMFSAFGWLTWYSRDCCTFLQCISVLKTVVIGLSLTLIYMAITRHFQFACSIEIIHLIGRDQPQSIISVKQVQVVSQLPKAGFAISSSQIMWTSLQSKPLLAVRALVCTALAWAAAGRRFQTLPGKIGRLNSEDLFVGI